MKIVDTITKRENKNSFFKRLSGVHESSREIEHTRYKLWYMGKDKKDMG